VGIREGLLDLRKYDISHLLAAPLLASLLLACLEPFACLNALAYDPAAACNAPEGLDLSIIFSTQKNEHNKKKII
jgi:hypothetical protein